MKTLRYLAPACLFLSVGLFTACQDDSLLATQNNPSAVINGQSDAMPWQPGMAFFKLKNSLTAPTRAAQSAVNHAKIFNDEHVKVEQVFDMSSEYANLKRSRGMDRWFLVTFDEDKDVNQVIKELEKDPAIEKVHGNIKLVPASVTYKPATRAPLTIDRVFPANDGTGPLNFSDPYLKYQWHYTTTIEEYGWYKPGAGINLFSAWQKETGDPNVVVAVMDSGIDFTHEDLRESAWKGRDKETGVEISGRNFWYAESKQGDPNELIPGGHGTHVAGTIAARNNNNKGVCGIAGGNGEANSGVRLMSCEIYGHDGKTEVANSASIAKAFEFAAENGANICNCSWGYGFDRKKYLNNTVFHETFKNQFAILKEGIDYFTDIAGCDAQGNKKPNSYMKGGLVFFASGNDGQDDIEMIPASYNRVVAVGATNSMDVPTDYMDKGPWVDILAPGGTTVEQEVSKGVLSTVPDDYYFMQTGPYNNSDFTFPTSNNYAYAQGTSMATPHVTGVAALVISKFGKKNSNFTNEDLRKRLLASIKTVSPYSLRSEQNFAGKLGVGMIDANFALSDAEVEKPNAPELTVTDYSNDATKGYYDAQISWTVTADNDAISDKKTAFAYDLYLYAKDNMATPLVRETIYSYDKNVGDKLEYNFSNLDTDKEYVVKMVAKDRSGNKSEEVVKSFKTRLNHAPVFVNTIESNLKLSETTPFYHKVIAVKDEDNHSWTYVTTELPEGVELKRVGNSFDLLVKVNKVGKFSFDITLTDQLGGKSTQHISYEVVAQSLPKQTQSLSSVSLFERGESTTIDLSNVFSTDNATEKLTYKATSSNNNVVKATLNGHQLTLVPNQSGNANVVITAQNGSRFITSTIQVHVSSSTAADVHAVYPIPAHSYIKALMRSNVTTVELMVTSIRGQKLITETIDVNPSTHEATLGVDRLAPGTYYLLVKTNRTTSKHTFIKK